MSSRSSTEPTPSPDNVLVGEIRRPHGVRGELSVEVLSDVPERFEPGATLLVVRPSRAPVSLEIEACRRHRAALLVRFRGFATREEAEELRGARLEVPVAASPPPPHGSFYYFQLVGCSCSVEDGRRLGVVDEVLEDGGGHLLRLRAEGSSLLVPLVREYLLSVDVDGKAITLRLPEGLEESCRSRS